jgi:hypothetical protein
MAAPNLDKLKAELQRLVDAGHEWAKVEDFFIGLGPAQTQIYQFALKEWADIPKTVREGKVDVRTGCGSFGARRSVAGFRRFISDGAIA